MLKAKLNFGTKNGKIEISFSYSTGVETTNNSVHLTPDERINRLWLCIVTVLLEASFDEK